jgi:hypothetical protein
LTVTLDVYHKIFNHLKIERRDEKRRGEEMKEDNRTEDERR